MRSHPNANFCFCDVIEIISFSYAYQTPIADSINCSFWCGWIYHGSNINNKE